MSDDPREPGLAEAPAPAPRRRWRRRLLWGLALGVVLGVPWWGRAALARLDFFRVRAVRVEGARYLDAADVVRRLEVDTLRSIWDELLPLERRVATHPQVQDVRVERELPGTLVVRVDEHRPVAFVPAATGLRVHDAAGRVLPIDPSRADLDLPVLEKPDTTLLRLLGEVQTSAPALFRRISEIRRTGDDVLLRLYDVAVRVRPTVSVHRLADILPVEADLSRRRIPVAELDLRFRDQVIARLQ